MPYKRFTLACGHSNGLTSLLNEGLDLAETGRSRLPLRHYLRTIDQEFEWLLRQVSQAAHVEGVDESAVELHNTPDLVFRASVRELDRSIRVAISRGVFLAIQDLALRATCSDIFFNPGATDVEYDERWRGTKCLQLRITLPPRHRYYDYTPAADAIHDDVRAWLEWPQERFPPGATPAPWISLVARKMPLEDERIWLAAWLMNIALYWIVLHERAHYIQGHLQHLRDNSYSPELSRAFEWQADRDATFAIQAIFFRPGLIALPGYASRDWLWLLRLLMTAIGLALLAIDRGRQVNGVSEGYPPPRTRLLNAIWLLTAHIDDRPSEPVDLRDPRHGNPGDRFDHARRVKAIIGTLGDLTAILQLTAKEERHVDPDPLWPLEGYAPFIMGPTLHWMGIQKPEEPDFRSRIDAHLAEMAGRVVACYGKPPTEGRRIHTLAQQWSAELENLILTSLQARSLR